VNGRNDCTTSRNVAYPLALLKGVGVTLTSENCMHLEIKEKIEVRECLLPLSAESSVFTFTIQE
jgi:ribosomal protein S13